MFYFYFQFNQIHDRMCKSNSFLCEIPLQCFYLVLGQSCNLKPDKSIVNHLTLFSLLRISPNLWIFSVLLVSVDFLPHIRIPAQTGHKRLTLDHNTLEYQSGTFSKTPSPIHPQSRHSPQCSFTVIGQYRVVNLASYHGHHILCNPY